MSAEEGAAVGLFDLQVNGYAGVDFQVDELAAKALRHATRKLAADGVAGILLTLVTDSVAALCRKFERIEGLRRKDSTIREMVKGYHLEGPWLSTEAGYYGAHPVERVTRPSLADYRKLRDAAGGNLRLITLAPEVEGAPELMEAAVADGIRIGLGHTNASNEAIDVAIQAGATLATHLGNAVPSLLHRHDNVVQRLLARDELIACLIPDGIHLPFFTLRNFYRAKPAGKALFTTDCMAAAGAGPGTYSFGPYRLTVGADGVVRLPGDSRFAGSSLTMREAVANATRHLGLDETEARAICSSRAAAHFGIALAPADDDQT